MNGAVGVDEIVCVYQCRGRASVFRTGHCVGFVVDLQGGQCRGDMTHTHFSDTLRFSHTLSHSKVIIPTLLCKRTDALDVTMQNSIMEIIKKGF